MGFEGPWPNPSQGNLTYRLRLARPGRVRALLLNADGRTLCSLLDSDLNAGIQELVAPLRGADGRALSGGVYFLQVETPDGRESHKFVILQDRRR